LVGLETLEYANNEPLRQQADNILDTYFYKEDENGTVLSTVLSSSFFVLILFIVVVTSPHEDGGTRNLAIANRSLSASSNRPLGLNKCSHNDVRL